MWWPSPMDQTCVEVKDENSGEERKATSLKRHSAWGLEVLLTSELSFRESDDKNVAGSGDDVTKASPTTHTDVVEDVDVTSCLDGDAVRTGEFGQTTESSVSDLFHFST